MKHLGDITKINGAEIEPVDCIIGGSPCQDLSVAGKRAGLAGERSGLFMEQIRIVKEMREHERRIRGTDDDFRLRPRYMVWENVPGAFSSNKGQDFQAVLTEIVRIVRPDAPDVPLPDRGGWSKSGCIMGYGATGCPFSIAWRLHDAQFWGVPQRRKRIALVADFGGFSAPEICFERNGLRGNSSESGAARKETAGTVKGGVDYPIGFNRERCGAVAVFEAYQHHGYRESETAGTLTAGQNESIRGDTPLVFEPRSQDGVPRIHEDGVVPTLNTAQVGQRQPCVVCVGNGQLNQISMAEQSNTLDTMHDQQAVMISAVDCRNLNEHQEVSGTLQNKENGGYSLNYQNPVRTPFVVRRLTPLECERLQGYPDGWTDIGEWVDSKGKKHKESDSPRYKALGNSIAVGYANNGSGFWMWLLKRISAQYERNATLGSLFDGIGGFPLAWEHFNGKGSARWASEIEEFPIAVTKKHFPED